MVGRSVAFLLSSRPDLVNKRKCLCVSRGVRRFFRGLALVGAFLHVHLCAYGIDHGPKGGKGEAKQNLKGLCPSALSSFLTLLFYGKEDEDVQRKAESVASTTMVTMMMMMMMIQQHQWKRGGSRR